MTATPTTSAAINVANAPSWASLAIIVTNGDTYYVTDLTTKDIARKLVNLRDTSDTLVAGIAWDAQVLHASMEVHNAEVGYIKYEIEASVVDEIVEGARAALAAAI